MRASVQGDGRIANCTAEASAGFTPYHFAMRPLLKSIVYRIFSFFVTWLVFYLFIRNNKTALIGSATIESIKFIEYYVFEIMWTKKFK